MLKSRNGLLPFCTICSDNTPRKGVKVRNLLLTPVVRRAQTHTRTQRECDAKRFAKAKLKYINNAFSDLLSVGVGVLLLARRERDMKFGLFAISQVSAAPVLQSVCFIILKSSGALICLCRAQRSAAARQFACLECVVRERENPPSLPLFHLSHSLSRSAISSFSLRASNFLSQAVSTKLQI
jgi:hypothetical protein